MSKIFFQQSYNRFNGLPNFLNISLYFWSLLVGAPSYSSFTEGWALYSEFLGHEMGLYDKDPHHLLGFYSFNLMRACRLVIDTGIHAKGWSRQQSIDYLSSNSALCQTLVEGDRTKFTISL